MALFLGAVPVGCRNTCRGDKPDLDLAGRYQLMAARSQAMKAGVKCSYDDPLLRKLMKATAELRIELRQERQRLTDKGGALLRPLTYLLFPKVFTD